MDVEAVLINGERRTIVIPGYTDSVVHALDRLDDWIQTQDGGWVQKKFIVEVRNVARGDAGKPGSREELGDLDTAATELADQADAAP